MKIIIVLIGIFIVLSRIILFVNSSASLILLTIGVILLFIVVGYLIYKDKKGDDLKWIKELKENN